MALRPCSSSTTQGLHLKRCLQGCMHVGLHGWSASIGMCSAHVSLQLACLCSVHSLARAVYPAQH
eukprot:1147887-Pelagomonas_calceolata.AAC.7